MKYFKLNNDSWAAIDWHQYIALNLAEHGCAIFLSPQPERFDFERLKSRLTADVKAPEEVRVFPINIYDLDTKQLTTHYAAVHRGGAPYAFFDIVRRAAFALDAGKFYACDLDTNSIIEMAPFSTYKVGTLAGLKSLLGLTAQRRIVGRWRKWYGFDGFLDYFQKHKAYSCPAEQAYYAKYGSFFSQFSPNPLEHKAFYSFEECQEYLFGSELKFDCHTALEFDISAPALKVTAPSLKARNLDVESVCTESDLFCQNIKAQSIESQSIFAASIVCRTLSANLVKTSFDGGISFIK